MIGSAFGFNLGEAWVVVDDLDFADYELTIFFLTIIN